jgi:hypothetical protein
MVEPIEDDTWVRWDEPIPPHLVEPLRAAAIQNGRTFNEEFTYRMMVATGMIPPSQTH